MTRDATRRPAADPSATPAVPLRSAFSTTATKAGFLVGGAVALFWGLALLIQSHLHNWEWNRNDNPMTGCGMILAGVPLFGIFAGIGFGFGAHLVEAVIRGYLDARDPEIRELKRRLAEDEDTDGDAAPDDRETALPDPNAAPPSSPNVAAADDKLTP